MRAGSSRDFAVCAELNWCRDSAFCQCGARILLNAVEVNPDDADGEKKESFYYLERFISYHL